MGRGVRTADADVPVTQPAFDLDATLAALADPQRRRVVELLREGPRRAGALAEALGLPAPAMSRHLRVLRLSGLVEESHPRSDARVRLYRLRAAPFASLETWLTELQVAWGDELAAFKAHIEALNEGTSERRDA
jgi:DNA-binding transcriptional ArsR family regulator